jgi:type VI secretion system protein VasG
MIDAILTNSLLPYISRDFLQRISNGVQTRGVAVTVRDSQFQYEFT